MSPPRSLSAFPFVLKIEQFLSGNARRKLIEAYCTSRRGERMPHHHVFPTHSTLFHPTSRSYIIDSRRVCAWNMKPDLGLLSSIHSSCCRFTRLCCENKILPNFCFHSNKLFVRRGRNFFARWREEAFCVCRRAPWGVIFCSELQLDLHTSASPPSHIPRILMCGWVN